MLMATGGGNVAVGDFTRFEKKTLTFPNAADTSTWEAGAIIPCSFEPKLVVCTTPDDNTPGCIYSAVFCMMMDSSNFYVGGARSRGTTGALGTHYFFYNANASANRFKIEGNTLYACRVSSGVFWNPSKTYTVEIYG
jgi:hypothetical protein